MSKDEKFAIYIEYIHSPKTIEEFSQDYEMPIDDLLKVINEGRDIWHGNA